MKAEYSVDAAVAHIGSRNDKMKALEIASEYNFMLYFVHFMQHIETLETIRNIGDITQISNLEMIALTPHVDTLHSINIEMGNISPEDYTEDGMFTRLCTQFSWGSRYNPPFVHSSDALNAVVATLAKLGK